MRIVFAGTPAFAVPSLRAAARNKDVIAVYTQPDRPAGRGRELTASAVKQEAKVLQIPVLQPESLRREETLHALRQLEPDLLIVVAYGLILPQSVLDIPKFGCWNVHASLLPRWRGAAPIQRAIEAGDTETGVCLMKMEAGLDTGPVLLSLPTPIQPHETAGQLHDRLAKLGAQVLGDGLGLLRAGIRPIPQPQSNKGVTYAHKLEKTEVLLDWTQAAARLADKVRAFEPWPVAEGMIAGERLRIHDAYALNAGHVAEPGAVLAAQKDGIDVACGEGVLRIRAVQRAGGRTMPVADYLNAHQVPTQRA